MVHQISNAAGRLRRGAKRWLNDRRQECRRCCDCDEPVNPWDEFCSKCGRGQPAKASISAGIVLVAGSILLLLLMAAIF